MQASVLCQYPLQTIGVPPSTIMYAKPEYKGTAIPFPTQSWLVHSIYHLHLCVWTYLFILFYNCMFIGVTHMYPVPLLSHLAPTSNPTQSLYLPPTKLCTVSNNSVLCNLHTYTPCVLPTTYICSSQVFLLTTFRQLDLSCMHLKLSYNLLTLVLTW